MARAHKIRKISIPSLHLFLFLQMIGHMMLNHSCLMAYEYLSILRPL